MSGNRFKCNGIWRSSLTLSSDRFLIPQEGMEDQKNGCFCAKCTPGGGLNFWDALEVERWLCCSGKR